MISIQNQPSTTLYNKLPNDIVDVTKNHPSYVKQACIMLHILNSLRSAICSAFQNIVYQNDKNKRSLNIEIKD